MIKYQENRNDIIQRVEIDLTEIPAQSRQDLDSRIAEYLKHIDDEHKNIFKFEVGNKLVYKTEVLTPKVNKSRLNILMVVGNPAVHSVAEGMFFSYERRRTKEGKETWLEHRFWRALRECEVLKFNENVEKPTPENIEKINKYKRHCLLKGDYISKFNIFLLPYFSFPTPSSYGVKGIKEIVGTDIFEKMKGCEFNRFKRIVLGNDIKYVICFQKTDAGKEIIGKGGGKQVSNILPDYPVYELGESLKHVVLYTAPPTRRLHINKDKKILEGILSDIRTRK